MEKEYKNKVIWLHKSKAGQHLYAFTNEGSFHNCKSILMNISEVEALIADKFDSIKVSIMEEEKSEDAAES